MPERTIWPAPSAGCHPAAGHDRDLEVQLFVGNFDVFLVGDFVQDEVFFQSLLRVGNRILAEFVFAGLNLFAGEAGLLHFQDFPPQRVIDLLSDQIFRQIPVCRLGDFFQHLLAGGLALLVDNLPFQRFVDFLAKSLRPIPRRFLPEKSWSIRAGRAVRFREL